MVATAGFEVGTAGREALAIVLLVVATIEGFETGNEVVKLGQ